MNLVSHEYNTETLKFMYHFSQAQKDSNYFDKLKKLLQNFDTPPLSKPFVYSEIISTDNEDEKNMNIYNNTFENKNLNISLLFEKKARKKSLFVNLKKEEVFIYLNENKKEKIIKKIDKTIDNLWVLGNISREKEFIELIAEKIDKMGLGFLVGGCLDVINQLYFYILSLYYF